VAVGVDAVKPVDAAVQVGRASGETVQVVAVADGGQDVVSQFDAVVVQRGFGGVDGVGPVAVTGGRSCAFAAIRPCPPRSAFAA
jgi:hydroxyethylthiazole kinase-like sugar kinase family protein